MLISWKKVVKFLVPEIQLIQLVQQEGFIRKRDPIGVKKKR
ncbi:hypothetical protein ACFP56_11185 [Paenibacillus septentrionalis]|uniref:Fur-regulated basic protein FbpA n=1 Tax=Paenibacillus septentrionalis TaxID=429342 RepID=A0ABW1V6G8_9BACL